MMQFVFEWVYFPHPTNRIPVGCFYAFKNSSLSHLQKQKNYRILGIVIWKNALRNKHIFLSMYIFLTCVYEYFGGVPHDLLSEMTKFILELDNFAVQLSPIKAQKWTAVKINWPRDHQLVWLKFKDALSFW